MASTPQSTTWLRFLHIPKCAGTSFNTELTQAGFTLTESSGERCLCNKPMSSPGESCNDPTVPVVTLLRSPRAHVYSQYLECRFDDWGKKVTKGTAFPARGAIEAGFERWLDHFLGRSRGLGWEGAYRCYNPWNMQSRALTCHSCAKDRRAPFTPCSNDASSDSMHRPTPAC